MKILVPPLAACKWRDQRVSFGRALIARFPHLLARYVPGVQLVRILDQHGRSNLATPTGLLCTFAMYASAQKTPGFAPLNALQWWRIELPFDFENCGRLHCVSGLPVYHDGLVWLYQPTLLIAEGGRATWRRRQWC